VFSFARKSEQDQVWVGMSKETAHQLGTPISSLLAWYEILKEQEVDNQILNEIKKDINRLETIAQRFSKIGSVPELKDENKLQGFNVDQRKEEVFKAKLIQEFSVFKSLLFEIEDSKNFKGNIANILKIPFVDSEENFKDYELESIVYEEKQLKVLGLTFEGYKEISKQDFNPIWGNLLNTTLYTQTYESRLVYSGLFKKHPAILLFAYAKDLFEPIRQLLVPCSSYCCVLVDCLINELDS